MLFTVRMCMYICVNMYSLNRISFEWISTISKIFVYDLYIKASSGAPLPDGDSPASKLYLSGEKDKIDIHENELLGLFLSGEKYLPIAAQSTVLLLYVCMYVCAYIYIHVWRYVMYLHNECVPVRDEHVCMRIDELLHAALIRSL